VARLTGSLKRVISPDRRRGLRAWAHRLRHPAWLGTLRRTSPVSRNWGWDRGTPVDRFYIEHFLEAHRGEIHGQVLEVLNNNYTVRYGRDVTRSDVLDIDAGNPAATVIADLADPSGLPEGRFDCFILTQTLQYIYDLPAAVRSCHRVLRPGGVLLVTVPALSRIDKVPGQDYWRFTVTACARLFGEVFGAGNVAVRSHGNVLTALAFLSGMAHEELRRNELDVNDPHFPLVIVVRAVKG
jgi:SAM-dependent methyltransferase